MKSYPRYIYSAHKNTCIVGKFDIFHLHTMSGLCFHSYIIIDSICSGYMESKRPHNVAMTKQCDVTKWHRITTNRTSMLRPGWERL